MTTKFVCINRFDSLFCSRVWRPGQVLLVREELGLLIAMDAAERDQGTIEQVEILKHFIAV